jgi:DNA polymerase (family 10)
VTTRSRTEISSKFTVDGNEWAEIEELRPEYEDRIKVLTGIECDILEKGGMDLPDDVLAQADWVLAAIHYGQQQPREQITDRLLEAIAHPAVKAVAHPTGRRINRREAYDDFSELHSKL